jgi:hypothetical protein
MIVESQAPNYIGGMIGYICANSLVIILLLIVRRKMAASNKKRLSSMPNLVTQVEDDLSDIQDPNFLYRL